MRGLLDATRKLERHLARRGATLRTMVFLRNDVFELLINETPDRGKEARVSLDWTDSDRLRELLRRRVIATADGFIKNATFAEVWPQICTSHYRGEESSEVLIELSLMRPRNLINLVEYCRSNAVNLGRDKIAEADIHAAVATYSHDMCMEISLEIRDVFPRVEDSALYAFLYAPAILSLEEVRTRAREQLLLDGSDAEKFIEILLWFSFLGVLGEGGEGRVEHYTHSVHYDMKKLRALAKNLRDGSVRLCIHRAFRPFLETSS